MATLPGLSIEEQRLLQQVEMAPAVAGDDEQGAATLIQSVWRSKRPDEFSREHAALVIQTAWLAFTVRNDGCFHLRGAGYISRRVAALRFQARLPPCLLLCLGCCAAWPRPFFLRRFRSRLAPPSAPLPPFSLSSARLLPVHVTAQEVLPLLPRHDLLQGGRRPPRDPTGHKPT
jgi:hypothetical protein